MTHCPHCGYNLQADRVVEKDGFVLDPRGMVTFNDELVKLCPQEAFFLHAVASQHPRPINRQTTIARFSEMENTKNAADGLIMHLRASLAEQGVPNPIETIGRSGLLRWNVPSLEPATE